MHSLPYKRYSQELLSESNLSESESAKSDGVVRWRVRVVVGRWRRRALTLTLLSLQGSVGAGGARLQMCVSSHVITLCDGAGAGTMQYLPNPESIVLRRSDFLRLHDYALEHAPLRDFCLVRVPMKSGLRPGEIRHLRWEGVDFDKLTLNTLDSKKHVVCPIPMDALTADYLKRLHDQKTSLFGWVIERDPMGKAWAKRSGPLGYDALDKVIRKWAKAAGVENWKHMCLYDLRHYFAASWAYPTDGKRPGNLHALSKIMRHKSMLYTQIYLSRLVFYEDLQAEFSRLQSWPFAAEPKPSGECPECGNEFFDKFCRFCGHRNTCRFMDQAMGSIWASGCKHFERENLVKEEMKHNRI